MIYALDSNIVSYMVKKDNDVQMAFQNAINDDHFYAIPPLVFYEVKRWLTIKKASVQLKEFTELYNNGIKNDMTSEIWEKAIDLYVYLRTAGKFVEDADIFIAAYCIVNDYVLVTNNIKHFDAINDLETINWKV